MKLNIPREWIARKAKEELESGSEITAGNPDIIKHVLLHEQKLPPCLPECGTEQCAECPLKPEDNHRGE